MQHSVELNVEIRLNLEAMWHLSEKHAELDWEHCLLLNILKNDDWNNFSVERMAFFHVKNSAPPPVCFGVMDMD